MSESPEFDVLIVGSGPSGAHAAQECVNAGLKVGVLDIGNHDQGFSNRIPERPFWEIRRTEPEQRKFFLGDDPLMTFRNQAKAGVHLTPARSHMIRAAEKLFPLESECFVPLQSTAVGGLGVSWGANCFTFESHELKRTGLPEAELSRFYDKVAAEIGVSGAAGDDIASKIATMRPLQPALELDTNARAILSRYSKARERFNENGLFMGQSVLAVLTEALEGRKANQYFDMDFWADLGRSVYRPQFTIEKLKQVSGFHYLPGHLVLSWKESATDVKVQCRDIASGAHKEFSAKRLILAAGAINSGKLALASTCDFSSDLPLLCNPNYWIAAINWQMLGQPAQDRRYSLSQLTGLMLRDDDSQDYVVSHFYSYGSLLLFRLLKDIPLPPAMGVIFARLILTSFTCINVHYSDQPSKLRRIKLKDKGDRTALHVDYQLSPAELKSLRRNERRLIKRLIELRCFPMGITRPAPGASIHYAGSLPYSEKPEPFTTNRSGKLHGTSRVFVGDGSSWNFLPAKGLTFTLMANARRVAAEVAQEIKHHGK